MDAEQMKQWTKAFALRVIRLVEALPRSKTAYVIGGQLLKSGTSVGANYRASCRARSRPDCIAKMGIVEEETDESMYGMELLVEAGLMPEERIKNLYEEADEILAITVSSIRTARQRKK